MYKCQKITNQSQNQHNTSIFQVYTKPKKMPYLPYTRRLAKYKAAMLYYKRDCGIAASRSRQQLTNRTIGERAQVSIQ